MVLISGNKSILQHPNDARSKAAHGVTVFHSPHHHHHHQQGSKNIETRPSHNLISSNLTKGMTTLDEFKYGFPSEGLSTTSNKWWGSSGPDADTAGKKADGADVSKHRKGQLEKTEKEKEEADTEMPEAGKEAMEPPEGAALLRDTRKKAVEGGREALKLGVFRGYGVKKIGKREKIILLQIFCSSLPSSWIHDL